MERCRPRRRLEGTVTRPRTISAGIGRRGTPKMTVERCLLVPCVKSDRSAVPASLLARFSGPLPEPDVRLPPHPALHEPSGRLAGHDRYPLVPRRRYRCPSIAVAGHRHCCAVEQCTAARLGPRPVHQVAASQGLPGGPGDAFGGASCTPGATCSRPGSQRSLSTPRAGSR